MLCESVLCDSVLCESVLCDRVLCESVLCDSVLCESVPCDRVLCAGRTARTRKYHALERGLRVRAVGPCAMRECAMRECAMRPCAMRRSHRPDGRTARTLVAPTDRGIPAGILQSVGATRRVLCVCYAGV